MNKRLSREHASLIAAYAGVLNNVHTWAKKHLKPGQRVKWYHNGHPQTGTVVRYIGFGGSFSILVLNEKTGKQIRLNSILHEFEILEGAK